MGYTYPQKQLVPTQGSPGNSAAAVHTQPELSDLAMRWQVGGVREGIYRLASPNGDSSDLKTSPANTDTDYRRVCA